MFSVLKLLKAETLLSISPGLKKGREAQKYEEKTVQENFHFKKMQPPPSSQTPSSRHHGNSPLLSHKMKGDSSLPENHHQKPHLHCCLWCTTIFNKYFLKI